MGGWRRSKQVFGATKVVQNDQNNGGIVDESLLFALWSRAANGAPLLGGFDRRVIAVETNRSICIAFNIHWMGGWNGRNADSGEECVCMVESYDWTWRKRSTQRQHVRRH